MKPGVLLVKFVSIFLIVFLSIQGISITPVKSERAIVWTPLISGTANYLNDVDFIDDNNGWVTGSNITLLKTNNAGVSWIPVTIPGAIATGDGYNSVNFLDLNTGFVSGIKIVARTVNGGTNWVSIRDSSSTVVRNASFPVSSSTVWVVGASGSSRAFFRYTFNPDNSVSYNFWIIYSMGVFNDVFFTSQSEGWAVGTTGSAGMIYHITNATSDSPTFSNQTSGTSSALNSIRMLDNLHGWIVGNNGVILYTSNGGATWIPKTSGVSDSLRDIHFIDSLHGWICASNGVILRTDDGGETWNPENSGVTAHLMGIDFSHNGTGYVVGQNGTILKRLDVVAPGAFVKTNPTDTAPDLSTTLTLTWESSSGATEYEYCYDDSNDNACSSWTTAGTSTNVEISGLNNAMTYYWHVRAKNAGGTTYSNGSETAYWSFTTIVSSPASFGKTNPLDDAINQPTTLTLIWESSSGATEYEYCYDDSNDNACSSWTTAGTSTNAEIYGLNNATTYYWHVRAVNTGGTTYSNGSETAFWSFTTIVNPPASFGKTSPIDTATNQSTSLTLTWESSSGVAEYEYCYDETDDDTCSTWISTGISTNVEISGLSYETSYYWHVRAKNIGGITYSNESSSAFWSFSSMSAPLDYHIFLPMIIN